MTIQFEKMVSDARKLSMPEKLVSLPLPFLFVVRGLSSLLFFRTLNSALPFAFSIVHRRFSLCAKRAKSL